MKEDHLQSLLKKLEHIPKKSRGQSFLKNPEIADKLVEAISLKSTETVVEVGAGLGAMTERIIERTQDVFIIEVEKEFCDYLRKTFPNLSPRIIHSDIRNFDPKILATSAPPVLISNVPYSISTDFIRWYFHNIHFFKRAGLLLQREFAERLAATPGNRAYGSLTIYRERFADIELGMVVEGDEFYPRVKVQSRAITLRPRVVAESERPKDELFFEKVVEASFSHKRKTLVNSLQLSGLISDKAAAILVLEQLGLSEKARAEELSLEKFVRLSELLVTAI